MRWLIIIIAAYAGTGKTTLAEMYPERIIDFVAMPYKYHLKGDCCAESSKANPANVWQLDWPWNYVKAIKEVLSSGKIILIPSDSLVRTFLREEEIPYILCYPQREAKEAYRKRFIDRGNSEDFIEIFIGGWDSFLDSLKADPCDTHIVMEPHEFLVDVIDGIKEGC
jgi:hypothetical protein